ncbi:type IV pilus twitching motility protein PilT [Neptuniibacter halophilus]|uniref:type IV pilus twitching motility protein PilT n=1 Tax=Neptuniibacter halophilus TaxID=651666 RepID=UPI0025733ED5|nr:ATPase, T2SS/T4P/T4SS family [Neptuniibacter halophilus]
MNSKAKYFEAKLIPVQRLPSQITPAVFDELLMIGAEHGASDVIFRSSTEVRARVSGSLQKISDAAIDVEDIMTFIANCETKQMAISLQSGNVKSFAYSVRTSVNGEMKAKRFRLSASTVVDKRSESGARLVCRPIEDRALPIAALNLPTELQSMLTTRNNKGIILITGETGSGKTTLLASVIDEKARQDGINIATLEDPVEFNLSYLNDESASVVSQAGIGRHLPNFSEGLRGLLRDNPDVIMVGEMRDQETIKLGVEASRTGHLVYSTIHVTSVAAIIDRMCISFEGSEQIEIAASLIDSLRCGVNQQLVAKLCPHCSEPLSELDPVLKDAAIDISGARQATGCEKCDGTGVSGRYPIIEYLMLTNQTRLELNVLLITKGLGAITHRLMELVEQYGQSKLQAAQSAFEAGAISQEVFVSIFVEYQTMEYLKSVRA